MALLAIHLPADKMLAMSACLIHSGVNCLIVKNKERAPKGSGMTFDDLVGFWKVEVFGYPKKKVKLSRFIKKMWRKELEHYLFWFRTAQYLHRKKRGLLNYERMAARIHARLVRNHSIDIMLGAEIGAGLRIAHRLGIVISRDVTIGKNLLIRQNTTIGLQHPDEPGRIHIGDNVSIGANVCVIGDSLQIGDGAVIGAMSFVNKDVPAGATFYTTHIANVRLSA